MDNPGLFNTFKSKIPVPAAPFMATSRAAWLAQLSEQMIVTEDLPPSKIVHVPEDYDDQTPVSKPSSQKVLAPLEHRRGRKKSAPGGLAYQEDLLALESPVEEELVEPETVDELFLAKLSKSMEQLTGVLQSPTRREKARRLAQEAKKRISARMERRVGSESIFISQPTQTTPGSDESRESTSSDSGPTTADRKKEKPGGTAKEKEPILTHGAIRDADEDAKNEEQIALGEVQRTVTEDASTSQPEDCTLSAEQIAQNLAILDLCKSGDWKAVDKALKAIEKSIATGVCKNPKILTGVQFMVS